MAKAKKKKLNKFFTLMLEAKTKNKGHFFYNGNMYVRARKNGITFYTNFGKAKNTPTY